MPHRSGMYYSGGYHGHSTNARLQHATAQAGPRTGDYANAHKQKFAFTEGSTTMKMYGAAMQDPTTANVAFQGSGSASAPWVAARSSQT